MPITLTLCQSPYGLGFGFSAHRLIFISRLFALSSPSWELPLSWPFIGHASTTDRFILWPLAVYSSSLPFTWEVINLQLIACSIFFHFYITTCSQSLWLYFIAMCRETYTLYKIDNSLTYMSALGLHNLLPFRHTTRSLSHKDSCLYMLCLFLVSHLNLTTFYPL